MPNYWIVGAMFGGENDQYEKFVNEGYWRLGHQDCDQPAQCGRRDQMRPGDRIAIKRMLGAASPNIEIRATGTVKASVDGNRNVNVDWTERDVKRVVPAKGCFASIHGPYEERDEWIQTIFPDLKMSRETAGGQATFETQ